MKRLTLFLLSLLLLTSAGCATKSAIKKTLQEDPALLMEVLHEQRFELLALIQDTLNEEQALARQKQLEAAAANPLAPSMRDGLVIEGKEAAPITVVEYSDFLCPFCVRGHNAMNTLLKKYPERIRVVYKHNPIKQGALGLAALYEAVAAKDPVKATALKNLLFAKQKEIYAAKGQGTVVGDILKSLGLDVKEMEAAAREKDILKHIKLDIEELRSFGMDGTPMYVVGGVPVRGAVPIEEFEAALGLAEKNLK